MSHKTTMERILSEPGFRVIQFNGGTHLRINDVIDVWPRHRRWMPSRAPQKVQQFQNIEQLRKIVRLAEQAKAQQVEKVAAFVSAEPVKKPPVEPISREAWLGRFA